MQRDRLEGLLRARPPGRAHGAALRAIVARLAAVRPATLSIVDVHMRQMDDLRCEQYVLAHEHRESIRATLLRPPGDEERPAILVCPGRNARLDQVTGVAPPDHPDRNVAEHLARAGFITLTMDYGLDSGLPEERLRGRDEAAVVATALELWGQPLLGALVEDATAGLAWLAGRPGVHGDHIGLFGHSLGAAVALHAALLDERPLPVCTASHLGSYPALFGRLLTAGEGTALPGILRHADLPDLHGALAPARLQLQYGIRDRYLDPADAAAAGDAIAKLYADVDAADRVEVLALPMGHGTGIPQAAEFFTRAFAAGGERVVSVPAARIFFDPAARVEITERIDRALASGVLTLGPLGSRLEELAEPWTGRPTAAVSSGSAALEIAFRTVGVAGRTVLVPVNTFFATAASAVRAGAAVDFVDMELDGLGMDPDALAVTLSTHDDVAAVVPVHIAGVVSPAMSELLARCESVGIAVIEDAAHAVGSTLLDRPAGAFGRLSAFSLYPTKVVTSGEGGLLAGARADLDEARRYRDQGKASFEANVHGSLGSNWRMSELHAAVGIAQLERLEEILAERRRLAAWYDEHLSSVPRLRRYPVPDDVRGNYYKYVALLDDGVSRPELRRRLRERHGVALAGEVYNTLLNEQPYFAEAFAGRSFERAEWFARHHVCLPLFQGMTERQLRAVVDALHEELS